VVAEELTAEAEAATKPARETGPAA
jgi:hypothetical protein